jgi:citrate lyase beta subunit
MPARTAKTSLSPKALKALTQPLQRANLAFNAHYPGEATGRQPVHTVYGGAHLFSFDTAQKLGALARGALEEYGSNFVTLAQALQLSGAASLPHSAQAIDALEQQLRSEPELVKRVNRPAWLAHPVYTRVVEKLNTEAIEDFRLDFEDGYGARPDEEEDRDAERGAKELAKGLAQRTLPPFIGFRIKALTEELRGRALRTLDLFVTTLVKASGGLLPEHFVITLPKVQHVGQIDALVGALAALEKATRLPKGALKFEFMVELTQTLVGPDGSLLLPKLLAASKGRCVGAHFGTYDYTASCNINALDQTMTHPACDFARHVMQVSLSRTGVFLSDGATNVMPIGPHRAKPGEPLSLEHRRKNHEVVHAAWRLAHQHIRDSLTKGFFQGWDLHPAQVPVRYATIYAHFFEALEPSAQRLKNFVERAAQATLLGDVFDDAATGQGLLNFFLRGINCGAFSEDETIRLTGLSLDDLRGRSFAAMLARRQLATSKTASRA